MNKKIRVRFAPSPTGGLHLGGVRTVLFNYLFAKQNHGDFILRIEDTDQTRFVEGAEAYIFDTLKWCGLEPDESPVHGGKFGPYRQSERKEIYRKYAEELVAKGYAYYAFDTAAELEEKRKKISNFQYNYLNRSSLNNSLDLDADSVAEKLTGGESYVIRIKMPEQEEVYFTDMIRGQVKFETNQSDDKVLLKADGMPTYHLAVVVDDYLMQITHAFRGEEWLPSAPVHILLWKYLFGLENMPQWAHLPLILKPDGHGKLSKRDGQRLGFPVFAKQWKDPNSQELIEGFKEKGFLPEAFINLLIMLGWNDGKGTEIFTLDEMIKAFSMERVHKGGAKFDYEKAKWFNQEWIKRMELESLVICVKEMFETKNIKIKDDNALKIVVDLVRERCHLINDFYEQALFFFQTPSEIDIASIQPKWNAEKLSFFQTLISSYAMEDNWNAAILEDKFKQIAIEKSIKPGELMLPLRIMLVGGKFGPGVFDIASIIGKAETILRVENVLTMLT